MGNYYLTVTLDDLRTPGVPILESEEVPHIPLFRDVFEAMMAYDMGRVGLHDKIRVRIYRKMLRDKSGLHRFEPDADTGQISPRVIETSAGRCIFNDILADGMPFYNLTMSQKKLSQVISDCFEFEGNAEDGGTARPYQGYRLPPRDAGGPEFRPDRPEDPAEEGGDHFRNGKNASTRSCETTPTVS